MNSLVVLLNGWSSQLLGQVWPMFWQSSLLILLILAVDLALRRSLRPAVRYALWLVVLVKLVLPPSLASPSSIGWWILKRAAPAKSSESRSVAVSVTYGPPNLGPVPQTDSTTPTIVSAATPSLSLIAVSASLSASLALLSLMLIWWRQLAARVQRSASFPDSLQALLEDCRCAAGVSRRVRLCVIEQAVSPAVCGLFGPVILLPRRLVESLSADQLRPILLHELIHLRRGDVWVNFLQTFVQLFYWWHPLLWLANTRIRRVREEAVDDSVMLALGKETAVYVPTLLEVAKLSLGRRATTLGLVGILESQGALRQRVERLLDFQPPRKAGLSFLSFLFVAGFAAFAVPMGPAPAIQPAGGTPAAPGLNADAWPDRRFSGYHSINLEPRFLIADEESLRRNFPSLLDSPTPLTFAADELSSLDARLSEVGARSYTWAQPLTFEKFSGGSFHWLIGGITNNGVNYLTREIGGKPIVTGANAAFMATEPDWRPLELSLVPWFQEGGILCQIRLGLGTDPANAKEAELIIPRRGAMVWAVLADQGLRKYQMVVLQESPEQTGIADSATTVTNSAQRINTLIQEAKLLYETGRSPEANAKLLKVLNEDPGNKAAAYYLNLIREDAFKRTEKRASDNSQPRKSEAASSDPKALYTRVFKVDPRTFQESLRKVTGMDLGQTNDAVLPLKEFFKSMGLDLEPPKAVFYKDKEGLLLARVTLAELEAIEGAIKFLNIAPPQVNVKVKFVELPVKLAKEFWAGLTNTATQVAILTEPQTRVALNALETKEGVKVANQASVTTLSERQTQIQWAEEQTVSVRTNAALNDPAGPAMTWVTNKVPIGSTVDIYPVVRADGYNIQLTVSASTTEFLGYDDPGQFVPQAAPGVLTLPITAPLPLPHFRTLQMPTQSAIVWDGQTLVLGRSGQTHASLVPNFGGDIPLVGRLFRSEPNDKDFIMFITPTIIDPAGNRVHSGDETPAPNTKANAGVLTVPEVLPPTIPPKPAGQ